jgi:23S rRNA (guanosine2251-2'-O)-methyltransferase
MNKRNHPEGDSPEYLARKQAFRRLFTICGRQAVLEALADPRLDVVKVHLAQGGRGENRERILQAAAARGVPVEIVPAERVSRISRNPKQDQGVAADLRTPLYQPLEDFLADPPERFALLALEGITTPANVGMAIRSAAAGGLDGVLLPEKGTSGLNPLVIKASVGAVFHIRILRCTDMVPALERLRLAGTRIAALAGASRSSLFEHTPAAREVYLLGSESEGLSPAALELADTHLSIPMENGVESLNVAVAASLVAYHRLLQK